MIREKYLGSRGKAYWTAGELVFVKQIDFFTYEKINLFLWLNAKTPRCSPISFSTPPRTFCFPLAKDRTIFYILNIQFFL